MRIEHFLALDLFLKVFSLFHQQDDSFSCILFVREFLLVLVFPYQ